MSINNLPKSLIDSVISVSKKSEVRRNQITRKLMAEGLRRFGVKREIQLSELDQKVLHAWVQRRLDEALCCDRYSEDHMPGDDVLYNDDGEMKKDLGEQDNPAADIVKAELEKMGKTLGELSPEEKKKLFNKVDSLIKAKDESLDKDAMYYLENELKESIAFEPDEIETNNAVAVGNAMAAEPVHADIIKDSNAEGKFEYRLLLQYATGGEIFLGAPYEGTHIYPPMSMPGAPSLDVLKDMIEAMPFYNEEVEKAIENAINIPSTEPRFKSADQV